MNDVKQEPNREFFLGSKTVVLQAVMKLLDCEVIQNPVECDHFTLYTEKPDIDDILPSEKLAIELDLDLIPEFIKTGEFNKLKPFRSGTTRRDVKSEYKEINLAEMEATIDVVKHANELHIGDSGKIIIKVSSSDIEKIKIVNILQELTGGRLSSVRITKDSKYDSDYFYIVEHIEETSYLYDLKLFRKQGLKVFYQVGNNRPIYCEMGFSIKDDSLLVAFQSLESQVLLKEEGKLHYLDSFSDEQMRPIFDLLDIKIKSENVIRGSFAKIETDRKNLAINVSLNVRNSVYDSTVDDLDHKIETYQKDLDFLEEIKDLEEDRKTSDQIVIISFENKDEVGRILSLFPSEYLSKIKILVFSSLSNQYYALYLKGLKISNNKYITKIYNCEKSFSHFDLTVFVEENRYIYPFFAVDKMKSDSNLEKAAYYKMFFSEMDDHDEVDISSIKENKSIVILDNSKDIFTKSNLIFFKESEFKESVISIYNTSLLSIDDEFNDFLALSTSTQVQNTKQLDHINTSMLAMFEQSEETLSKGYGRLKRNWNKVSNKLYDLENHIEKERAETLPKVNALLKEVRSLTDLEDVSKVITQFYENFTNNARKLITEQHLLQEDEDNLFKRLRSDWDILEKEMATLRQCHETFNMNQIDKFRNEERKIDKSLETGQLLLSDLKKMTTQVENKLDDILKVYNS